MMILTIGYGDNTMLKLQCQNALAICLCSIMAVVACSSGAVAYGPVDAHTWGINNAGLGITAGNVITKAKLTVQNAAFDQASTVKTATIRLLNNPALGMTSYPDAQAGDYFADCGALIAQLKSGSLGSSPQNVVIDLGQKNDPAAPIWQNFGQPFEVTLGDGSKVSYSSVMVALLDYAGSGRSFGFGVDCDGFTFTNLLLELTVASMTAAEPAQTIRFSASGNMPPVFDPISDPTIAPGQLLQFTVSATDSNGDALVYSASGLPAGATFNNRVFSWTPSASQEGDHQVTFNVTDGAASDSAVIAITVTSVSIPAEIIVDNRNAAVSMVGSWPVSGGVNPYGSDSVYNRSAGNSFSWLFTAPETGSYEVSMWWTAFSSRSSEVPVQVQHAAGIVSLTVNQLISGGQWNTLGTYQYQAGTTYRVTVSTLADNTTICADAVRFAKSSAPVNHPPLIAPIADQTVTIPNTVTFTIGTSDADGDSVAVWAQNLPPGSNFSNKVFSWTPSAAQAGAYEVTFIANDGNGGTNSITVQITVQAASSDWTQLTYDDFESGWGNYVDGGTDCVLYKNSKYAHQGSQAANIQSGSGTASSFRSQNLDVSSYSELKVGFWYMPVSMESGDTFRLDYFDGSQWRRVKRWAAITDFRSFTFYSDTVTILKSGYAFPASARIRFVCEGGDATDDVMIDEITVSAR